MIRFDVMGQPRPQGSAKAFIVGKVRPMARVARPAGPLLDWRAAVSSTAASGVTMAIGTLATLPGPLWSDCAVVVGIVYRLPLRKGDLTTRGQVRADVCAHVSQAPDIDKLDRAVLDGITAAACVWRDDAQVAQLVSAKLRVAPGQWVGAAVVIGNLAEREDVIAGWNARITQVAMALNDARVVAEEPLARRRRRVAGRVVANVATAADDFGGAP